MSLEDFQLLDSEPFDNSIIKRDYLKVYHQQGGLLNDPDQNTEFILGENNNYHQNGNAYLENDISVRDPTVGSNNNAQIRLVKNGLAYCFKEPVFSTTRGMELEHTKFVGQVSTIMRSLTIKNGDLLSYLENTNEEDTKITHSTIGLLIIIPLKLTEEK